MATELRSRVSLHNLQELLDASGTTTKVTLRKGQAQYLTPPWFARTMAALLPGFGFPVIFDPQCGEGTLLDEAARHNSLLVGVDLDRRPPTLPVRGQMIRLSANCVDVWQLLDEFFPRLTLRCQVANPPFGLTWATPQGKVDSTLYTWARLIQQAGSHGAGYMIASRTTIERFGLQQQPQVYLYQTFPVGIFDAEVEIGVLHFHGCNRSPADVVHHTSARQDDVERACGRIEPPEYDSRGSDAADVKQAFETIEKLIAEARRNQPPFNVYLADGGFLRTYLSIRTKLTRKLTPKDIERLARIDKCHPLTLTTEKESRTILAELVGSGVYTIQPEARAAIDAALREVSSIACPIMPITDFERVAYADEEEALKCVHSWPPVSALFRQRAQAYLARPSSATWEDLAHLQQSEHGHTAWQLVLQHEPTFPDGLKNGLAKTRDGEWRRLPRAETIRRLITQRFTAGRTYPLSTGTYAFTQAYQRMRLHLAGNETYSAEHDMTLSGQDRFIEVKDDHKTPLHFQDRPDPAKPNEVSDALLWELFEKPLVLTVAEKHAAEVAKNRAIMEACELLAGFSYYAGQRDFYSRVAVRDYALVGAATGTGKTLGVITLVALKAPKRALIVAPQGTTRAKPKDDDEIEDLSASQWISELRRFAPGLQVFELFSADDYERICSLNGGQLPHGVYVSYYEAMFSNRCRESATDSFDDGRLAQLLGVDPPNKQDPHTDLWTDGIGHEEHGIRCIVTPCLATRLGHLFDFVALDEAHKGCHLSANVTQMIIRLQPRYRYALTATPIPNLATDLFPLMGWLCVPGWYRGGIRNAAWPYAREDGHRFSTTFLSTERDLTQEEMNKAADPSWRGRCEKVSPVISSPARLLKLIKPTMAYISKQACNPAKPKLTVHDVRVPMGRQQARLYGHYMNRANISATNAMVRAAKQVAILRALCADPAGAEWNRIADRLVRSNFNPKAAAVLSLVRDILRRGEQVLIVSARLGQSDFLQRRLTEAGVPVSRIDSSLPPVRHTEQAQLFKSGRAPIQLMGIKCAQAHSYEQCPNLIIGSLEYAFGPFEQATGRIDRVTSRRPMHVYCVLHRNSIEEIMFDIVATKGDAATICLRGERVPRDFVPADLGEILARNFESFQMATDMPDESEVETTWPELCRELRAAAANHPCQLAR